MGHKVNNRKIIYLHYSKIDIFYYTFLKCQLQILCKYLMLV